jgi:hypothetical protein
MVGWLLVEGRKMGGAGIMSGTRIAVNKAGIFLNSLPEILMYHFWYINVSSRDPSKTKAKRGPPYQATLGTPTTP